MTVVCCGTHKYHFFKILILQVFIYFFGKYNIVNNNILVFFIDPPQQFCDFFLPFD